MCGCPNVKYALHAQAGQLFSNVKFLYLSHTASVNLTLAGDLRDVGDQCDKLRECASHTCFSGALKAYARALRLSTMLQAFIINPIFPAWGPYGVDTHPRDAVFNFSLNRA